LGEKLPIEESNNIDTKVIEGVEGTRTVDKTDPSLSRPLRISFSEGYEPTIKIAQEFTGIELSKEYTAETIEKPIKWDRAISIPSNQGFDSVILESEDINSDPLKIKEPVIKSQESQLKSRAKKSSKTLGYTYNDENYEIADQPKVDFVGIDERTTKSTTDKILLKGVPQGFNQPFYDVEELQYEGIKSQTPNLHFQKNYSTQKSENQSAYLGVRFTCINVYMFTHNLLTHHLN